MGADGGAKVKVAAHLRRWGWGSGHERSDRLAGYKQTEVGVIPEDWDVAGLLDAVYLPTGQGWIHLSEPQ